MSLLWATFILVGAQKIKNVINKAYAVFPKIGALITFENKIDDNRNKNSFRLLMSLKRLIEISEGYYFWLQILAYYQKKFVFKKSLVSSLRGQQVQ